MFDLNDALLNWRRRLAQTEAITAADIKEMETHLHEEMQTLAARGLTEDEAFLVAARRLGDTADLTSEFAKVNETFIWRRRFCWMLMGVLLFMVAHAVAGLAARGFTVVGIFAGMRGQQVGLLSSLVGALVLVAAFCAACRIFGLACTADRPQASPLQAGSHIALLMAAAMIIFICRAGTYFLPLIPLSLLGAEASGMITLGAAYGSVLSAVVAPFVLAAILIIMTRSKSSRPA